MTDAAPGDGGFWELGGYEEDLPGVENPWIHGTNLAPFDQEVSTLHMRKWFHLILCVCCLICVCWRK